MTKIFSLLGLLSLSSIAQAHEEQSTLLAIAHHWFALHHGALGMVVLVSIAAIVFYKKARSHKKAG